MPILYSFRRCPYAIRARMALRYSGVRVQLREVVLRDKPPSLLIASPKGTVPVLLLADDVVLDESLDIMHWALANNDPQCWQPDPVSQPLVKQLIAENDGAFKTHLDRYKYADRQPQQSAAEHRAQAMAFLQKLEARLQLNPYLLGPQLSLADVAIFPFIRQFAGVDHVWFAHSPLRNVQQWLEGLLQAHLFTSVMGKHAMWQDGDPITLL